MRRFLFLALAALGWAWAAAAAAADQPVYAPPPAWVKPLPIPRPSTGGDGGATKVLLDENQSRLAPEGQDYFTETASQVLSPQGLSALGNLQQTWDPATETLVIHKLQILRDGKTIDLLDGGRKFTVLRRETNLDWAMLDGRLTANFQPEGLQVGDVLVFAYSVLVRDPVLQGYSTHFAALTYSGVASRVYFRTLWPKSLPIRWKQSEGMGPAVVTKSGPLTEVIYDQADVEAPKPPVGAPMRFADMGIISFSQYRDWKELSGLFAADYDKAANLQPDSQVAAAAARIAAQTSDPKARTLAALRLVEDQVRYVFLGMNDGGYAPAAADETWSRKFGDCKGKTVLLVALLRRLGVEAAPALVSTQTGDGIDSRLPTVGWFDHAIVRVRIGAKVYWLDGTRSGDRSLDDLIVPPFHWALPLVAGGTALDRLEPAPLETPWFDQKVTIDATSGVAAPAKGEVVLTYRGESAVQARAGLASMPRPDYERSLRENLSKAFAWLNIATIDIKDDPTAGVTITAAGSGKLDWADDPTGSKFLRVTGTGFYGQAPKRQPGPHDDAPYAVAFPFYSHQAWRIALPAGLNYLLVGPDVDRSVAGLALKRTAKLEGGVLSVETSGRALVPEYPAAQVEADAAVLRQIGNREVVVIIPAAATRPRPPVNTTIPSLAAPSVTAPRNLNGGSDPALKAAVKSALDRTQATYRVNQTFAADKAAAEAGDAAAQVRLSKRYDRGDGVPIDTQLAADWLQKAAAGGNAEAQIQLGQNYARGRGVPADLDQSLAWFRKAADQGDAVGQRLVGQAYLNGESVKQDRAQAIAWLERAAAQGDSRAKQMLEDARATKGSAGAH
ncbi:DUF3857 domain-containing protein [Phenylobacterium sp.]|jgi:hypothetical protein|uniref:DUF3857 domain-containing protein n=1 Tax=Phenylobacterium sp. TaxID=1871053 RepID=UPI002F4235D8